MKQSKLTSTCTNDDVLCRVSVRRDVVYSVKKGYWCENFLSNRDRVGQMGMMVRNIRKRPLNLKMDIYSPLGDVPVPGKDRSPSGMLLRPAVILLHGGAFYMNSKTFEPMPALCRDLASHGYVAASIDYRMGFRPFKKSILNTQYDAADDAADALDFISAHAVEYGIDTARIALGGSSSGAIASFITAFSERGKTVKALINMWGAVYDLNSLDALNIPVLSLHGDADTTVPYTEGVPMNMPAFMDPMYGSKCITKHMTARGKDATLITFKGYRHAPQRSRGTAFNENWPVIRDAVGDFLHRVL